MIWQDAMSHAYFGWVRLYGWKARGIANAKDTVNFMYEMRARHVGAWDKNGDEWECLAFAFTVTKRFLIEIDVYETYTRTIIRFNRCKKSHEDKKWDGDCCCGGYRNGTDEKGNDISGTFTLAQ
jgi:hypothetical protein